MGQHEHRLKSLADDQLLAELASIVGRRNQITAEFLAYLAELDQRQIFLDLGFSSLFEYCVETLGLCESTAGRHIAAARVCRKHPQVFAMVASGALHASALSLLRKHLTAENAEELFELCKRKSARKVEELLAARFPKPDVRDSVRRLPAQNRLTLNVGCASEKPPPEVPSEPSLEKEKPSLESRPHEPLPAPAPAGAPAPAEAPAPAGAQKPRRLEPLSADRYGVHFTADGEFRELLERVRGLAGHRLQTGDLMTLIKRGLEAYERELTKERFALGRKPRRSRGIAPAPSAPSEPDPSKPDPRSELDPSSNPKRRRYCPAAVARAVYLRDRKQCSYVSPDGRRCNARRCLELDHVEPWAVGGECTIENLRLRCRAHNQRYARQYFGALRVEAALRRSRRWRATAEPQGNAEQS
ncbi:MAG: HNH endonuclease signature motif containing protein [Polyangiaceae bacterium]